MSLETQPAGRVLTAPVAAVILIHEASDLAGAMDALDAQVYEPTALYVVGGDEAVKSLAEERGATWAKGFREVLLRVPDEIEHLWLVHDRARPRPGALHALVTEAERVDASVAGSKMLNRSDPSLLESIGVSTDVFDVPYSGLEPGELDQHQYEVVRDVAVIPAASLLVRRDLIRGLGGPDPRMAPQAAVIDFCQRARLRGARIVVVPTSGVLYPPRPTGTTPLDEEAGRIRAMLKVYSLITLLWSLPLAFLTQLMEAIVAPLLGRWTLWIWVRTWLWNLLFLPSTISARLKARRGRVVGDSELFRYQVRGSARLRYLGAEIGDRVRERIPESGGGLSGALEAGQQTVRNPGFLAAAGAAAFALLASRSIWAGTLPAVGYTLPPSESATATLGAYAGGWNVAGLGSPEPLQPAAGAIALAQFLLLDKAEFTAAVLTVLALIGGAVGMARLLRHWGLRPVSAYLGGVVLIAGPAAHALAASTEWTALLALGVVPWVIRVALRPWPESWRGRVGRVATVGWLSALMAAGHPALLVVPAFALVVWALIGQGTRWIGVALGAGGAVLAVLMLFPWVGVVSLNGYLQAGSPTYWDVYWLTAVVVVVAAGAISLGAERVLAAVAAWGGILAVTGIVVARLGTFDAGRNVAALGMVLSAIGVAAAAGAAMEAAARYEFVEAWRRVVTSIGIVAGGLLVVSTLTVLVPGRAGLPADVYRSSLSFTSAQVDDPQNSRVLLAGPAELLPGDSRQIEGAAYRVVAAPVPRLWESLLNEPRLGDEALQATLQAMVSGEVARAGEALAPFGIRWVVVVGDTPFQQLFEGQLDMIPLQSLEKTVFLSEADPHRAVGVDGVVWEYDPPGYRNPNGRSGAVILAENADQRWGPGGWQQADWGNRVDAADASVGFAAHGPYRLQAMFALVLFLVLFGLGIWGTGRKAR